MRIRQDGRLWEVFLDDDGTLDTVLTVQPVARKVRIRPIYDESEYPRMWDCRFDCDYASTYRRQNGTLTTEGFKQLAKEAINLYPFDE